MCSIKVNYSFRRAKAIGVANYGCGYEGKIQKAV